MLKLRPISPFICSTHLKQLQSIYVRSASVSKAKKTDSKMKFLHEEKMRYINSTPSINIISDVFVEVYSADVHQYPNGDAFIARLHGGPAKNCPAIMNIRVSEDDANVEVVVKKLTNDLMDFHCSLAVPIKASLNVCSKNGASVSKMFGDILKIKAEKYINIFDVKADIIEVENCDGNIVSRGALVGRQTKIENKGNGHIMLDRIHGDQLNCKANNGNITANCCYVESSKFETNSGTLDLQNVHKNTEIHVHRKGNLKMTGVHGNIKVNFNGDSMELQLSELVGQNFINVKKANSSIINISDEIENNTKIEALSENADAIITLDTTLEHLTIGLHENKQHFKWPPENEFPNKLHIAIKDSLKLGKSSWMETLKVRMDQNLNNNATEKS